MVDQEQSQTGFYLAQDAVVGHKQSDSNSYTNTNILPINVLGVEGTRTTGQLHESRAQNFSTTLSAPGQKGCMIHTTTHFLRIEAPHVTHAAYLDMVDQERNE